MYSESKRQKEKVLDGNMRKKKGAKSVEAGAVKQRPRRGAAKVALKVFEEKELAAANEVPEHASSSSAPSSPAPGEERQPLCPAQTNVPRPVRSNIRRGRKVKTDAKMSAEHQARLQAVQQLCDTIDAEVESRIPAIRAMVTAQSASFKLQMDLQISKFSTAEQNMPLSDYVKANPGIECAVGEDGKTQLHRSGTAFPRVQDSMSNLQDMLTKAKDKSSKGNRSALFTPKDGQKLSVFSSRQLRGVKLEQESVQKKVGEEQLSWNEYYAQLQAQGFTTGVTDSMGSPSKQISTMSSKGGLGRGVTPKTVRVPKEGEAVLSINGSPLGLFGMTPGFTDNRMLTRSQRGVGSANLRDV